MIYYEIVGDLFTCKDICIFSHENSADKYFIDVCIISRKYFHLVDKKKLQLLLKKFIFFNFTQIGLKTSKSKISPHKHNSGHERQTVNKIKTSSPEGSAADKLQDAEELSTPEDKTSSKLQLAQDSSNNKEDKFPTSSTTAIKGILKRPNEETPVNDQQLAVEESLPIDNLDQTKATVTSDVTTDSNGEAEMFDPDDAELPFASLTDEEKKIIGLTMCLPSGNIQSNLVASQNSDLGSLVSSSSTLLSSSSDTSTCKMSSDNNTGNQVVMSHNEGDIDTTDVHREVKVEQIEEDDSNEIVIDKNVQAVEKRDEMSVDSRLDCFGESHDFTVANEKSRKSDKSRKRKSVPLQISDEGCQDKTPLVDVTTKKRKSQPLPCRANCSVDSLPVKSEEGSKTVKKNEGCINQENALKQFFMSTPKSTKSDHSRKSMLNDSSEESKAHKAVFGSPVKLGEKSPIRKSMKESLHHQPKKKHNLSETEINFFGPSKKAPKTEKAEKHKKSKEKAMPVKTLKPHKTDRKATDQSDSICKTKLKISTSTSTGFTILSSDESDMSSSDNLDLNAAENNSLKRIWDDFELPVQNDSFLEEDSKSPVKQQTQELPSRKMLPSTSKEISTEKQPSLANALGLGKKQRVAHTSSQVSRMTVCVC